MAISENLLPELVLWNAGAGISADAWICGVGQSDHALGYCALLWPEFEVFERYVLRTPVDVERLRSYENAQDWKDATVQEIETVMNISFLERAFPDEDDNDPLKAARLKSFAAIMADMWDAKLRRAFPDRSFSTFVIDNEDDFGVSFHQT